MFGWRMSTFGLGGRVGVLAKVWCPPGTPNNETSAITKVGGSRRALTTFLNWELRLGLAKSCSSLGQLPHISESKLRLFLVSMGF